MDQALYEKLGHSYQIGKRKSKIFWKIALWSSALPFPVQCSYHLHFLLAYSQTAKNIRGQKSSTEIGVPWGFLQPSLKTKTNKSQNKGEKLTSLSLPLHKKTQLSVT